ncbi:uncharacterized protein LOC124483769 isoform X2 [Hypomesus transpacificus]|uniref:uncharacterized protein LOC124483769 isoform X2 n=1 Tax=Hypomesus transpacificus TaxID=137520 RepID=UPI001F087243|nr:uncharacterized protein LOC124483769 isoform X2 [Hypomesus transpacificus]
MKPLIPTRVGGTRWLAHLFRALDHFLRGYRGLIQHFEQIQSPDSEGVNPVQESKARNFYQMAKDPGVVMFSCFLHDSLTHLSNLSASMQRPSITVAEVQSSLIATQAVLTKHKNRPGPRLRSFLEDPATFEGVTLAVPREDLSLAGVNSKKDKLIDTFCSSMATRFCDFSSGVLHASKLVDITSWPKADTREDFGDADVDCLMSLVHNWLPLGPIWI